MSKRLAVWVLVACVVGGLVSATMAARFEILFRIVRVTGVCTVEIPGGPSATPAVEGRAYPYGTKVRTGEKSSAEIVISDGNWFVAGENAIFSVAEDPRHRKTKVIQLSLGKINVTLEEKFRENEDALNVATPVAVCSVLGWQFNIESLAEDDVNAVIFSTEEGALHIFGSQFDVPEIKDGNRLSVTAARDQSFTRLTDVKGLYAINVRDSEGNPKIIEMKPGSSVKIWRGRSETRDIMIVTIIQMTPEGLREGDTILYRVDGEIPDELPMEATLVDEPGELAELESEEPVEEEPVEEEAIEELVIEEEAGEPEDLLVDIDDDADVDMGEWYVYIIETGDEGEDRDIYEVKAFLADDAGDRGSSSVGGLVVPRVVVVLPPPEHQHHDPTQKGKR